MLRHEKVDLFTVSKEMGHTNITTTTKHYLHLTDQDVNDPVRKARAACLAASKSEDQGPAEADHARTDRRGGEK
jgi:hypothetical protein